MNVIRLIRRLGETLLYLSFLSFSAMPIAGFLGIQPPEQLGNIIQASRSLTLLLFVGLIVTVALTFGLGYLILTGWRGRGVIPWPLRLLLAFLLGAVAFWLGGPLGMLMPLPILPTIIASLILWAVIRAISNLKFTGANQARPNMSRVVESALSHVKHRWSLKKDPLIKECRFEDDAWKLTATSDDTNGRFQVEIDPFSGDVVKCRKLRAGEGT